MAMHVPYDEVWKRHRSSRDDGDGRAPVRHRFDASALIQSKRAGRGIRGRLSCFESGGQSDAPWHFLNFFPDPHGQGSFRPTLLQSTGAVAAPDVASLRLRARPAPTITGSRFAAAARSGAGVSAGPTSRISSTPVATGSSGTTSSSTPSALYRRVGAAGAGGSGSSGKPPCPSPGGPSWITSWTLRKRSVKVSAMSFIRSTNIV